MSRAFPRIPRSRMALALVASAVLLGLVTVPSSPAPAQDLDDRKRRVQQDLRQAHRHFNHSSAALTRAVRLVRDAEERLREAERDLQRRELELTAAVVVDTRMQAELDAATVRLEAAREALAQGRRDHHEQEAALRQIAAQTYQVGSPTLLGLSMVLTSDDPTVLSSQLHSVQSVLDKEASTLSRLEASKTLLVLQEERVREARAEVAVRRAAAAETLAHKRVLESRARQASARVADRVQERTAARREAARAKAADRRQLRQLQKERDKISRLLRKRAAAIARKRSRAALARARAASRARGGALSYPVDSYVTSPYGMRLHPVYHAWTLHDGTDFGAGCGQPIRAAASGRTIATYYNTGYGRRVIIAHGYLRGASVSTTYNHLSRYSTRVGQRVRRGEIIGFAGTSGYSTGCHLHFMVFRNGVAVDPMRWL